MEGGVPALAWGVDRLSSTQVQGPAPEGQKPVRVGAPALEETLGELRKLSIPGATLAWSREVAAHRRDGETSRSIPVKRIQMLPRLRA